MVLYTANLINPLGERCREISFSLLMNYDHDFGEVLCIAECFGLEIGFD